MFSVTWIHDGELVSVATPNARAADLLWSALNGQINHKARLWFTAKGGKLELVK